MAWNVRKLQWGARNQRLIAGANALVDGFWCNLIEGLAVHGASLGGMPPVDIGPTNWRDADIGALLDMEPHSVEQTLVRLPSFPGARTQRDALRRA